MSGGDFELVFEGNPSAAREAESLLESRGIRCRRSDATKSRASIRVAIDDAVLARRILGSPSSSKGRVISASEAAWFRCPRCSASLTEGQTTCSACGEYVR